jgi:hypothetical protein
VREGAARRRVVRLRRGKCRRAEQESPAKGGVKSGHSHVFYRLRRFQSLDESLTPGLASLGLNGKILARHSSQANLPSMRGYDLSAERNSHCVIF